MDMSKALLTDLEVANDIPIRIENEHARGIVEDPSIPDNVAEKNMPVDHKVAGREMSIEAASLSDLDRVARFKFFAKRGQGQTTARTRTSSADEKKFLTVDEEAVSDSLPAGALAGIKFMNGQDLGLPVDLPDLHAPRAGSGLDKKPPLSPQDAEVGEVVAPEVGRTVNDRPAQNLLAPEGETRQQ